MSTGSTLLMTSLLVLIMYIAASAFSKRPATTWNYYHFDGHVFVAGQPNDDRPFLAILDRMQPVVLTGDAKIEAVAIPANSGALAGICYIQNSGGKLVSGRGYAPCPLTSISISSGNSVVTSVQSDDSGYFVALLPAGVYHIKSGAYSKDVTVDVGKTTISPLQTGKRMVD